MSKDSSEKVAAAKPKKTLPADASAGVINRIIPWNPWIAVVFVLVVFFLSQLIGGLIVSIYPLLHHWNDVRANNWLTNSIIAQFFYVLLAEVFTVGAIYLFLRIYKRTFRTIGLEKPRLSDPANAVGGYVVYLVIFLVMVALVKWLVPSFNLNQQQEIGFSSSTVHGPMLMILTFISLSILPPLAEEIMVRGLLYSSLKKGMPIILAAIVTSAIFASAHLAEGGSGGPLYIAGLDTFILSLVLCYLREKTGSLWAGITVHFIKNTVAFASLYLIH